jgi:hypothetical protein
MSVKGLENTLARDCYRTITLSEQLPVRGGMAQLGYRKSKRWERVSAARAKSPSCFDNNCSAIGRWPER